MNDTYQVMTYVNVANIIGDDIRTIERNKAVLLNICKDMGLTVNLAKRKYTEAGRSRGMMANQHIIVCSNYEKVKNLSIYRLFLEK